MRLEKKRCITLDDAYKLWIGFKGTIFQNFGDHIDYLKKHNWRIL